MKYNFVYDTDFIEKNILCLSEEECNVVFATVVGKHNAIFYGYKPERLVKAIKKLTTDYPFAETSSPSKIGDDLHNANCGILYIKDFNSWGVIDQQFLYSYTLNDRSRCVQTIATTSLNPFKSVVPDIINNFDIIYMCKEGDKHSFNKTELSIGYAYISTFHNSLHSGRFITSTQLSLANYWLMDNAYEYLCDMEKRNPVIARKVAMVSRSVSDYKHHTLTDREDISIAERLCGLSTSVDLFAIPDEVWK